MSKSSESKCELDEEYKPDKDEQVDEEEFEEEQSEKPSSSTKRKRQEDRDKEGNQIFQLSNKRRITIRKFSSGEASVDIREVYLDKKTNEMRPGKGICLPMAQWSKLKELLPDIDEAIEAISASKK